MLDVIAEFAEGLAGDSWVVAGVRRVGEVDFALVALAGEEDRVAVDGHSDGVGDGFAAVWDDGEVMALALAGLRGGRGRSRR